MVLIFPAGYTRRHERLNRLITEFMAEIFEKELRAYLPELPSDVLISVSEARLNRKKTVVTIYVAVRGMSNPEDFIAFLNKTRGIWRHLLSEKLRHHLRFMPEIRFELDTAYDRADRIFRLLENIKKQDK